MEQELISKKDLLEVMGISYGQLYRWKRKNLIPEEWFIRKSTFTGQETFFPREKMLARLEKIKNMKDDLSLDELANMFSPNLAEVQVDKGQILEQNIVSRMSLELYEQEQGEVGVFSFDRILYVFVLEKMLQGGEMSLEEGKVLLQVLTTHYEKYQGKSCELFFVRKMGIATFVLISVPSEVYFEAGARVVSRLNLADCVEELKGKLTGMEGGAWEKGPKEEI